ncbi:MAG: hypothetical protein JSR83_07480 [Proteobacteria bacterium]|nr:hypothetical protein [Pseudomonadota bacterium]
MTRKQDDMDAAYYSKLGELSGLLATAQQINGKKQERAGFVSVLDEAQEAHAAFRAVAGLADCAGQEEGLPGLKGSDLAALLRVVNARLGRAIDVAFAASASEKSSVVSMVRD